MKRNLYTIMAIVVLLLTLSVSCNKSVISVTLNETYIVLDVGKTAILVATILPDDATNQAVTWTSSNPDIVFVNHGTVTAKAIGTVNITVTTGDGNHTAKCVVTVEQGVVINGVRWATRNLAARGKFVEKPEDHGALFQWGRAGDGHELRTSLNSYLDNGMVNAYRDCDAHGQIVSTHNAYGKFVKQNNSPFNWRNPKDDALWNSGNEHAPVKTVNDPCPNGWRLPTQTELATLGDGEWEVYPIPGRRFGSDDNHLFLPAAGCRNNNLGAINFVDMHGYYWSSSTDGAGAYCLIFYNIHVNPALDTYQAYGHSIRCVAE